jgi:SAM-dependent methyltransferase
MDVRTIREKLFHDERFADGHGARPQDRFYVAVDQAKAALNAKIDAAAARGGTGLEIGCSTGVKMEQLLRQYSFEAHGIDISEAAISAANSRFNHAPRAPQLSVMDANHLEYPSNFFDFVFGCGILHHLQLPHALHEVHRVLKPGGHIIFMEPLGTNPLIDLYRWATPSDRSPDETPLTRAHLGDIRSVFGDTGLEFFGLFSLAGVPLQRWPKTQARFMSVSTRIDRALFKLPAAWSLAWMVVMDGKKLEPSSSHVT